MPKRPARPSASVREPVQVYLAPDDRDLLSRLTTETGLTKAEILRQGLRSFAREQGGASPMLKFVAESKGDWPESVAEKHDEILADSYVRASKKRR